MYQTKVNQMDHELEFPFADITSWGTLIPGRALLSCAAHQRGFVVFPFQTHVPSLVE